MKKLQNSARTQSYHKLPQREIYQRCYEIYHNLGLWLWEKSDVAIQAQYNELGERRFEEGIPLAQVLWAIVLTKERLLEYLGGCGLVDSAIDLYQQQEFVRLIDHFFDRAVCYTGEGFERRAKRGIHLGQKGEVKLSEKSWPQHGQPGDMQERAE